MERIRTKSACRIVALLFAVTQVFSVALFSQIPGIERPPMVATSPPSTESSFWGLHGDTLVFVATVGVAFATIVLAWATWRLTKITHEHVEHSRKLVEGVERIHATNALMAIATSLPGDPAALRKVVFKNVGRVAARLEAALVRTKSANGAEQASDVPQCRDLWLSPGESEAVDIPALARIWMDSICSITVEWSFDTGVAADKLSKTQHWSIDHHPVHLIRRGGIDHE